MIKVLNDNPALVEILIALLAMVIGYAARGWIGSQLTPVKTQLFAAIKEMTEKLGTLEKELKQEIGQNREAAQKRDLEHTKELAELTAALKQQSLTFERQAAESTRLQGEVARATFTQGKHDQKLEELEKRLTKLEESDVEKRITKVEERLQAHTDGESTANRRHRGE